MADEELSLRLPQIAASQDSPRRQTYRSPRTEVSMSLPPLSYRSAQSFDPRRPTYHNHVVYGSPLWHRDSVQATIKPRPSSGIIKSLELGFVNDAVKTAIFTRPRKIPIIPDYYAERDKCARAYFKSPMVQDTMSRASKFVKSTMIIKDTSDKDDNEEIFITRREYPKENEDSQNEVEAKEGDTSNPSANGERSGVNQRMLPVEIVDTLPADNQEGNTNTGPTDPSLPNDCEDSDSDYGHPDDKPCTPSSDKVTTLPQETVANLPADQVDSKPSPVDGAGTLPIETGEKLPEDNIGTTPDETATTLPADTVGSLPAETATTLPADTAGSLPADDQKDEQEPEHHPPDNDINYPNLWPNEKYSKEYRGLPEFIVRLYTEEYDVSGKRPTINKLSVRHRCRSTPSADDVKRSEREFVNDAIITEKKRTKYKDIIPPYDASRDRNARAYFMREDIKQLLGVTRSAR